MRKSLKNTNEVCHYFANQVQSEGYAGNVSFKGGVIQTSRGAGIPLSFAPRLWLLVNQVIKSGENLITDKKVGHYTLTNINKDGDITVGCHFIKYSELERIAKILGYIRGNQC